MGYMVENPDVKDKFFRKNIWDFGNTHIWKNGLSLFQNNF